MDTLPAAGGVGQSAPVMLHLFADHVRRKPDAEAVCSSNGASLSYRHLDDFSWSLAARLVKLGVGSEVVVPVCFEKSTWTAVAMLAVLKAGGAFVLLDPSHPTERLQKIIDKCSAKLAVTSRKHHERVSRLVSQALCLDESTLAEIGSLEQDLAVEVHPDQAAYVVFTSGSTGEPKGAVIEHRSFCLGALGHAKAMHMDATSRVAQFASYSFDASITEILTTLTVGGTVCVILDEERLDVTAFTSALQTLRVSFALLTASFINVLQIDELPGMKTLVQGGEELPQALLERWADRITLINAYGQVEAAVVTSCSEPLSRNSKGKNIGKAIAGRCWVVNPDNADELTPQGEAGELLVEGPHVGRGYLGEPGLTAKAFIGRPAWHKRMFAAEKDTGSSRFYRTGDLVVQEEDGALTFHGRKDNQVKRNGQRIEIGEIEHQLKRAMTKPWDIIVELVKKQNDGGVLSILVGFVALGQDWSDDLATSQARLDEEMSTVKKQAGTVLPQYMMPSFFMAIQSVPIAISGKVDHRGLQALGIERMSLNVPKPNGTNGHSKANGTNGANVTRYPNGTNGTHTNGVNGTKTNGVKGANGTNGISNRDPAGIEAKLRKVWATVLNIEEQLIERTKAFQSLGGDSISAMQVVSQAARSGLQLTVQQVLGGKTIEKIVASLKDNQIHAVSSQESNAQQGDEEDEEPFNLSPIQRLFFQLAPDGHNQDNISFLLRLNERISGPALDAAIDAVVSHHPMLRARFFSVRTGKWFQYISGSSRESYRLTEHTIHDLTSDLMPIVRKSQRGLDIQRGPLMRAELLHRGQDQYLFICAHHLVTDFVSWRVILEQIQDHLRSGQAPSLKSLSFKKWCQEQDRNTPRLRNQEPFFVTPDYAFWDMEKQPNVYGDSVTEVHLVDRDLSSAVFDLGQAGSQKAEVVDILLSAAVFAFRQTFPERGLPAITSEGHGREPYWDESIDLSSTVGWFTTLLPMLFDEQNSSTLKATLQQAKDLRTRSSDKGVARFASSFHQEQQSIAGQGRSPMEVTFNYAGFYQQLERPGSLFSQSSEYTLMNLDGFGESLTRFGLVEILVNVEDGRIKFSFTLNSRMKHQDRIRVWMKNCEAALEDIVSELSPAHQDFPLLQTSSASIAHMMESTLPSLGVKVDDVEDIYPCSPMQNGMLLSQATNRGCYISQLHLELSSTNMTMDTSRLVNAWQAVVDRHAALRTVFVECDEGDSAFNQVVLCHSKIRATQVDGSLHDHDVPVWAPNEPQHHLFFASGPSRIMLRLDINHAMVDGYSTTVLMSDLQQEYDDPGTLSRRSRPLYRDYIEQLRAVSGNASVDYWNDHLTGISPCHLPSWGDAGAKSLEFTQVPLVDTPQVMNFCRTKAITVSDLFKAAWAVVLRSYTGSDRPVFGYLTSTRQAQHDETVGVITNIQPCVVQLPATVTIEQVLDQVQSDGIEQMMHSEVSLSEVTHVAGIADGSGRGLFNTAVTVQKKPLSLKKKGTVIRFAAALLVNTTDDSIEVIIEHWTSSLSTAQAQNISATLSTVVNSMVRSPHSTVENLDVVSDKDLNSMIAWNAKLEHITAARTCIHECIEKVRREHPYRPAIQSWDGHVTYEELGDLSDRLAGHLHTLGVGPEQITPVCMEKSLWSIVSMLSILKAGGAFVPFDPAAPAERLTKLKRNCASSFVLASPSTASRLDSNLQKVIVTREFISGLPLIKFQSGVMPENLAYVLFTSGSTGEPKGILMQHSQYLASSDNYSPWLDLGEKSRVLQFSAYTFDASMFEIWSTLIMGGCVCQISDEQRMNVIEKAINNLGANTIFMTPTVLSLFKPAEVPNVHTVIVGGEVIPQSIFRTWAPSVRLVEAYGPSETAVYATLQMETGPDWDPQGIGRSFCCRPWVVDVTSTQLVPIGAVGELWLEGPSLARGYLNSEAQTRKAFVTRPSFSKLGEMRRFYRTGDMARLNVDGSLYLMGRRDDQVKIRGQRLELREVEHQASLLLDHGTSVAAQAVDSKLILLVESRDKTRETVDAIISRLKVEFPKRLPRFMIPSTIVPFMGSFPRMSSGKLDRKRLRAQTADLGRQATANGHVTPSPETPREQKLRRAISNLFNLPLSRIHMSDNFHSLGGDSLLAMKLSTRVREEHFTMSAATILRHPNLSDMAKQMMPMGVGTAKSQKTTPFALVEGPIAAIQKEAAGNLSLQSESDIEDIYPVTPLQEAFVIAATQNRQAYEAHHIVKLGASSEVDVNRFRAAWETCVKQAPILRTRIFQTTKTKKPQILQVILKKSQPAWEHDDDLESYLQRTRGEPTTFGSRVAIIQDRASDTTYFVWVANHTLYDGVALDTLLRRVHSVYVNGPELPQMPPFRAYVEYLRSVQASKATKDFWRSYLAGTKVPSFPSVQSGKTVVDESLEIHARIVKPDHSATTLATALQSAWAIVLDRWSGETKDVVFGCIMSGRSAPLAGADEMLGPLITAVPIRVSLNSGERVSDLLSRMQEDAARMIPHETLGLQNIRTLSPDAARAVSFKTLLAVQPPSDNDAPWEVSSHALDLASSYQQPLNLVCSPLGDGVVKISATYASSSLSREQVEKLVHQFASLSQSLVEDEGSSIIDNLDLNGNRATFVNPDDLLNDESLKPEEDGQAVLRSLWAECLGIEAAHQIASDADFLSLGGDSISAMQLSGIARRSGYILQVPDILQNTRMSDMASVMKPITGPIETPEIPPFSLLPDNASVSMYLQTAAKEIRAQTDDLEDIYPCTSLQESLMTLSHTHTGAYIARLVVDLNLEDTDRFKTAWEKAVATFPILRTRIVHLGADGMFQVVVKPQSPPVEWPARCDLDDYLARDRLNPMKFGAVLNRAAIVTSGKGLKFVWTAHHSVYDGTTVALLSEAVSSIYAGKSLSKPVPYSRFVKYEKSLDPEKSDAFWRQALAKTKHVPFPLPLTLDYAPHLDSVVGYGLSLGESSTTEGITAATMIQVAWAYIISKYSGSSTVALGIGESGRLAPVPGIDSVLGPVAITVPMRVDFDDTQDILSTARQVQDTRQQSILHYHRGLQNIRRVSPDARHACEFQSLLNIIPQQQTADAGLPFNLSRGQIHDADAADFHIYPLVVDCELSGRSARLSAAHDSKMIESKQMYWMLQQLEHVLKQMSEAATRPMLVRQLELLTPDDKNRIRDWGACASTQMSFGNSPAWIVDVRDSNQLVPVGVVGELVVGDSIKTATSTGQLARYRSNGTLETVGFKADMILVDDRHFVTRDVEKVISKALGGLQVSVQSVKSRDASEVLKVTVALGPNYLDEQTAQRHLDALVLKATDKMARALPMFMLPRSWVAVRHLEERTAKPPTTNSVTTPQRRQDAESEPEEMERQLLLVWSRVFPNEDASASSNFFHMGGDSIDAMTLVSEARREGIVFSVNDVLENPTVPALAQRATRQVISPEDVPQAKSGLAACSAVVVEEVASICHVDKEQIEDIYPCAPLQEGLMFLSNMEEGAYIAEYVVRVPDLQRTESAWEELVNTTPTLRTRIVPTDMSGCVQAVMKEGPPIQYRDNLDEFLASARKLTMSFGQPLAHAGIVTEGGTHRFVLFLHHAIFDGWSWNLMLDRLSQLYHGNNVPPATPYSGFIDYIFNDLDLEACNNFWRSHLEGAECTSFPPSSNTDAPNTDAHETRRISFQQSRTSQHTVSSMVQTAWALLLAHYTDSRDVVVGVTLSGRGAPVDGIQDMIGPTFTTIPMRFRLDRVKTASQLLDMAQHANNSPMQHYGLQRIRQVSASAQAACSFNTLLVVQSANDSVSDNFFLAQNQSNLLSNYTDYGIVLNFQLLPGGGADASCIYDSKAFSQQRAIRLLDQLDHILQQLCRNPGIDVRDIECSRVQHWTAQAPKVNGYVNGHVNVNGTITPPEDFIPVDDGPKTVMEAILGRLLSEMLGVHVSKVFGQISLPELGVDSLGAMRLASKAHQAGYALAVSDIMRRPHLADLATVCKPLEGFVNGVSTYNKKPSATVTDNAFRSFLEDSYSIDPHEIEDTEKATFVQAAMARAAVSPQQGAINHVWLDFDSPIDVERLRQAVSTVIDHHGILRTAFVPYQADIWQVVFRRHEFDWEEYHTHGRTLEDATKAIISVDTLRQEEYGRHGLRLHLVHNRPGDGAAHRLILRLPHTLYDGISLPIILDHLRLAYEGLKLPEAPSFTSHVRAWRRLQNTSGAREFWIKRLRGSAMTNIVPRNGIDSLDFDGHVVQRFFLVQDARRKHSFESTLHSAWAIVLSRMSGKTDVVFGKGIANRNMPLHSTFSVCGPTLNLVPVRVQLDNARTRHDLLSTVDHERSAASAFEHLETDQLVSSCTDWGTPRFGTLLVYNNLEAAPAMESGIAESWGGIGCKMGGAARPWDNSDFQISVTPEPSSQSDIKEWRIDFIFSKSVISQDKVESVARIFCHTIAALERSEDAELGGLIR
ncbi:hypothetical protein FDECE_3620 [Fusarium decemcellulare]|nr:hypothetical protein FDECE_3620 [Fusarium decemcellulare]